MFISHDQAAHVLEDYGFSNSRKTSKVLEYLDPSGQEAIYLNLESAPGSTTVIVHPRHAESILDRLIGLGTHGKDEYRHSDHFSRFPMRRNKGKKDIYFGVPVGLFDASSFKAFLNELYSPTGESITQIYPEILPGGTRYVEGAASTVTVNAYERSPAARDACIRYHGWVCKACDIDFEKTYGERGRQFIHVHHIIPIASIGTSYEVDAVKDLVPVCPNCHAMIHRRGETLTVAALRALLATASEPTAS